MELSYESVEGYPQVTVLHVAGRLDGSSYLALIDQARELFASGTGQLILGMEACEFLSSAGMFALHNIALMANNFEPLDPEDGWSALKSISNETRDFTKGFKMVNLQPNIMRTLSTAGVSSLYGIYPDLQAALATI